MISQRISSARRKELNDMIPHIVQTACAYRSVVTFEVNDKRVNAKSIMGVMALASQDVSELRVSADGEDEEKALKAIADLLE